MKPYAKVSSTPVPAPQVNSAVNYVQPPENVLWMDGGRGFTKRPGSLPAAQMNIVTPAFFDAPIMLTSVRAPSWITNIAANGSVVTDNATCRYYDPTMTLMWVYTNNASRTGAVTTGLYELAKYIGPSAGGSFGQPYDNRISRAVYTRTDADYYAGSTVFGVPFQTSLGSSLSPPSWKTLSELRNAAVGFTGPFTSTGSAAPGFLDSLPALFVNMDTTDGARDVTPVLSSRSYTVRNFITPKGSQTGYNNVGGYGTEAGNLGNMTAIGTTSGIFIGGAGGAVMYYDGFEVFPAGAVQLSTFTITKAAGGQTGDYQYALTHKIALQSGEVIEGEPATQSTTLAAQQTTISQTGSSLTPSVYNNTVFSTATTGTATAIDSAAGAAYVQPGQKLVFFVSAQRQTVTVTSVSGSTINVTPAVTGMAGTTYFSTGGGICVYRTKASGSIFYRVGEMAYGQSLIDNTADGSLTVQYTETATLRLPPPTFTAGICEHQGRLCVLASSSEPVLDYNARSLTTTAVGSAPSAPSLWFSSALSKLYFDPANSTSFTYQGKSAPTGLISINNLLYVFFENRIYYIQGDLSDATSYTVNLLDGNVGCPHPKSIVQVDNEIYFVSQNGPAKISGTTVDQTFAAEVMKLFSNPLVRDIRCAHWRSEKLLMLSLNEQRKTDAGQTGAGGTPRYWPEYGDVLVNIAAQNAPIGFITTTKPQTLVYSYEAQKWALWDVDIYGGATEVDGDLLMLDSSGFNKTRTDAFTATSYTQYITRLTRNANWTDTGKPFTARYYSEWYDAGVPALNKSFDRAAIFSTDTKEAGGQGFKLSVRTERDWQPGLTVDQFDDLTDFKVDYGYAEQPYDSQPYGDPELSCLVLPLSNQECKSLRLVLENSEPNRNIAINATAIELAAKFANMKEE